MKWWCPIFRFVVDVAINNAYHIYCQSQLSPREYRLDALGSRRAIFDAYYRLYRKSLPSTTVLRGSCSLHHPQTFCSLTVSITGLPRAHTNGVAYEDVKEPQHMIAKSAMSVFILNVLNYITVSRAVCEVYLKQKKKVINKNVIFHFSFSLFIILAIEHKISRDQIKIFFTKITERGNIKVYSSLHNICLGKVVEKSFYTSIFNLFQFIFTLALLMLASV